MKLGHLITANTEFGIGVGKIHTLATNAQLSHFAQVRVDGAGPGGARTVNIYIKPEDEDKRWIQGHDKERLAACLAAEAMKA